MNSQWDKQGFAESFPTEGKICRDGVWTQGFLYTYYEPASALGGHMWINRCEIYVFILEFMLNPQIWFCVSPAASKSFRRWQLDSSFTWAAGFMIALNWCQAPASDSHWKIHNSGRSRFTRLEKFSRETQSFLVHDVFYCPTIFNESDLTQLESQVLNQRLIPVQLQLVLMLYINQNTAQSTDQTGICYLIPHSWNQTLQ